MLAAFVGWERRVGRRRRRQPLVDLSLFQSAGFTWGTVLATMISFALFGLTFAMPQFFLDVKGLDSLASGIRMLPLIGGLAVGLGVGQRLQSPRKSRDGGRTRPPLLGPRPVGAGGFAIMAVALAVGTATSAAQRDRIHLGLVRGDGLRAGPGDADDAQRGTQRADAGAQRVRVRADDRHAAGRSRRSASRYSAPC